MSTVQTSMDQSALKFAQVALPIHLRKLFTYRIPDSMQQIARVGSRVMVHLGTKPITGYIVALLPELRTGTSLVESELKEVEKLLDVEPSLTADVIEIARWVADYYAAPLGEVMRAALPAGINTQISQVVSITHKGRKALQSDRRASAGTAKIRALRLLADEGEIDLNAFCLRMGSQQIPKWLRELERERLIERTASHYDSSECSSNGTYPNNLYGWGLPDPNNLYGWGLPDAGKALRP